MARTSAQDRLLGYLDGYLECVRFGCELLLATTENDYCWSVELEPPHSGWFDEYGVEITPALAKKYGLPVRNWYLKFRLYEDESSLEGSNVFFISIHPLEKDMRRKGGLLKCETK